MDKLPYPLLYETLSYCGPQSVFKFETINRTVYAKLSRNPYFL